MKEFKRIIGRKLKLSVVYPSLYMLEDKSYVVDTWMDNGRRRIKDYKVTRKGEALFSSVTKLINVYMGKMILDLFIQ
jgi:DNA-binding PadR family transcriptional regulator